MRFNAAFSRTQVGDFSRNKVSPLLSFRSLPTSGITFKRVKFVSVEVWDEKCGRCGGNAQLYHPALPLIPPRHSYVLL